MKKTVCLLAFFCCCLLLSRPVLQAQPPTPPRPFAADAPRADRLCLDAEGNVYAITDVTLRKFSPEGALLASYSDYQSGTITSIDASNPLKIMIFHQETGTIVFVDKNLVPISEKMNLFDRQLFNVTAAAYSTSGYIWLYDATNQDLLKLDFFLNEKERIHQNFNENVYPSALQEMAEKSLMMTVPGDGVYFFDVFGTFLKRLPLSTAAPCQVTSQEILYLADDTLHQYLFQQLKENIYQLPIKNARQLLVFKQNCLILDENGQILSGKLENLVPLTDERHEK